MSTITDPPSTNTSRKRRLGGTTPSKSTKYNFRIQSAPPLSIQQSLRLANTPMIGTKPWQSSGKYHPPIFKAYLSPVVKEKPTIVEPRWHPPGRYIDKKPTPLYSDNRPKSPSSEKRSEKNIDEPPWHPPNRYIDQEPISLRSDNRPKSPRPEKRLEKNSEEPTWLPPGRSIDERPTSMSPEKRPQKSIHEPVWRPAGKFEHKPVPYFDAPNLRWSLQELLRSMPELRPKTFRASSSMSNLRKSKVVEDL